MTISQAMTDSRASIRAMKQQDIAEVHDIEKLCQTAPWSQSHFENEVNEIGVSEPLVAVIRARVAGFIVVWYVAREIQINNIGVHPKCRRQGIGRILLSEALRFGREKGCDAAHLEVRQSNTSALHLYKAAGFQQVYLREGYYSDNLENAIVMKKPSLAL